jgi:MraZ protein
LFLGRYKHSLDYKSRTSIPKKFREQLHTSAILTSGLDGCLFLYSKKDWEQLSSRFRELPLTANDARDFSRYLFSGAVEVSFDALGRIVIPDYLVKHAKLERELVILGVLNRVEIWSKKNFLKLNKKLNLAAEDIAEKLTERGI